MEIDSGPLHIPFFPFNFDTPAPRIPQMRGHCKCFSPKDLDSELDLIVVHGVYLREEGTFCSLCYVQG